MMRVMHVSKYPPGITAYSRDRCRCDECRAVKAEQRRRRLEESRHPGDVWVDFYTGHSVETNQCPSRNPEDLRIRCSLDARHDVDHRRWDAKKGALTTWPMRPIVALAS